MSDVEQEQLDEIKAWWADYGKFVIAGVLVVVVGLIGFNRYTAHEVGMQEDASDLFEVLAEHVGDNDIEQAEAAAAELTADYASTNYAAQAQIALSRLYMDNNRDQDAADALAWVVDGDSDNALKDVARTRLARVLLYQEKPDEVIDLLSGETTPAYAGMVAELRGDAQFALGEYEQAAQSYRDALADVSPNSGVDRQLVAMKLSDVPVTAMSDDDAIDPALESAVEEMVEDIVEDAAEAAVEDAAEAAVEDVAEEAADLTEANE